MRLRSTVRRSNRRRGAEAVEFAMTLPIFFMFLWGMIEVGRGFMVAGLLSNAAQAGARAGILPSSNTASVTAAVNNYLTGVGVSGYTTTVQVNGASADPAGAATGAVITVNISVPVANIVWLPFTTYLSGTIRGQFTLPHE